MFIIALLGTTEPQKLPSCLAVKEKEDKRVTSKGIQSAVEMKQISIHSGLLDPQNILLSDKTKQDREYYVQYDTTVYHLKQKTLLYLINEDVVKMQKK